MDIRFLIGWYLFLFVIAYLLEKLTSCFSRLSIFTVFFCAFFLKHGVMVPFNTNITYEQMGLELSDIVIVRWISSLILMYTSFVIGLLIARRFFGKRKLSRKEYKQDILQLTKQKKTDLRKIFPIFAIFVANLTFWMLWNPGFLVYLFSGDISAEAYRAARVAYGESVNANGVLLRIANTLKFTALPLCLYTLFFLQAISKKYKVLFVVVFIVTFLLNLISGQKGGVALVLLGVFFCWLFLTGNITISLTSKTGKRLIGVSIFLLLILIPFQYMIQYPGISYLEGLTAVANRVGGEVSRTLQLHFYLYPDIFPHLYGASSSFSNIFTGNDVVLDPGRVVRGYIAFGDITDATGSWNAAFIGTAWADFGYFGVVVQSILVVCLLSYYHQWFVKSSKTPGVLGTYVALSMSTFFLSEGNFLTTLFSFGLGLNFLFYLMLRRFRSTKKEQTQRTMGSLA
jgi:oligosaccharide repeat unit polymerase